MFCVGDTTSTSQKKIRVEEVARIPLNNVFIFLKGGFNIEVQRPDFQILPQ
jgi:hypothetical protein